MMYKAKPYVLDCKKITTAIKRAKKELSNQKVHECFGQEYVRTIRDKFNIWEIEDIRERDKTITLINDFENWCEFEITNITNSGRFNNGKTLSLKFIRCNDERMIGRISRGNPMSELYGMEIIKR